MMALKQILDLGIFIINENLKTRINGPYYLIIMFGWKESAEKKNDVEFYILWCVSLWKNFLNLVYEFCDLFLDLVYEFWDLLNSYGYLKVSLKWN